MQEEIKHLGKTIGFVKDGWGEKEYHTFRTKEHFMRMFLGFGISDAVLSRLKRDGINKIKIFYDGVKEKSIFITSVEHYIKSPLNYTDNGDRQQFVPIGAMKKIEWKV